MAFSHHKGSELFLAFSEYSQNQKHLQCFVGYCKKEGFFQRTNKPPPLPTAETHCKKC